VVILSVFCLLILPYLQKKLFAQDWTDGLHLKDMPEYTKGFEVSETADFKEQLDLTEREHEVFVLLLEGLVPKEIANTLKVSYETVRFHTKNLYGKLGIRSRTELFSKYRKN